MTGRPVPKGADAVVMVGRTEAMAGGASVRITVGVTPRQNIMPLGDSLRRGEVVLRAGHDVREAEIGLLAEVGRSELSVFPQPRVALLSTGNELVEANQRPAAGQIRNSNGPMLAAAVRRAAAFPSSLESLVMSQPICARKSSKVLRPMYWCFPAGYRRVFSIWFRQSFATWPSSRSFTR